MECPSFINKEVCVEANVKVSPRVCVGDVESTCVGRPKIKICPRGPSDSIYMVKQLLCVEFPLIFSADVKAEPSGIICDPKQCHPCPLASECTKHQMSECDKPSECKKQSLDCDKYPPAKQYQQDELYGLLFILIVVTFLAVLNT